MCREGRREGGRGSKGKRAEGRGQREGRKRRRKKRKREISPIFLRPPLSRSPFSLFTCSVPLSLSLFWFLFLLPFLYLAGFRPLRPDNLIAVEEAEGIEGFLELDVKKEIVGLADGFSLSYLFFFLFRSVRREGRKTERKRRSQQTVVS